MYEKRPAYRRCCWYVHSEVLSRFGLEAIPVPCQWTYLTAGAREELREEATAATGSQGNSPTTPQTSSTMPSSSNKRKGTGSMSITKFMKKCSDRDKVERDMIFHLGSNSQSMLAKMTTPRSSNSTPPPPDGRCRGRRFSSGHRGRRRGGLCPSLRTKR